jgi:hypothetical protein
VTGIDLLIRDELAPLLPLPDLRPDWGDVVRRARPNRRVSGPRMALVAAVLAAALVIALVTPVGAAIGRLLGDFSAWVSGEPGTPASPAEQQEFQRANERSWTQFAPGTQLRRLARTSISGTEFTLYGFRTGDSLCLRLAATGVASASSTRCAPLHHLQTANVPALVVAVDEPIGSSHEPPGPDGSVAERYSATFGIASDGVKRLILHADDGDHEALIVGNAFLYVADHPKAGTRVRSVEAVAGDGLRVALPFASSPYGMLDLAAPPTGTLHGPDHVERKLNGGTIGWIERLDPRGEPVPAGLRAQLEGPISHGALSRSGLKPLLMRLLQPDANDFIRIAIVAVSPSDTMTNPQAGVCYYLIDQPGIGGTCAVQLDQLFRRAPFTFGATGSGPSEYSIIGGLASDDVAAIKVFLGSGAVLDAALRDNAYLARIARSDYPIRVVAYDKAKHVIALETFENDGMSSPAPAEARKSVHEIARVNADRGGTLVIRAGVAAGGYRCYEIRVSEGGQEGGCTPWPPQGPPLQLLNLQRSGHDLFLTGPVPGAVDSVTVTFSDGKTAAAKTIEGFVAYPLPAEQAAAATITVVVQALDRDGQEIAKRGLKTTH